MKEPNTYEHLSAEFLAFVLLAFLLTGMALFEITSFFRLYDNAMGDVGWRALLTCLRLHFERPIRLCQALFLFPFAYAPAYALTYLNNQITSPSTDLMKGSIAQNELDNL